MNYRVVVSHLPSKCLFYGPKFSEEQLTSWTHLINQAAKADGVLTLETPGLSPRTICIPAEVLAQSVITIEVVQ